MDINFRTNISLCRPETVHKWLSEVRPLWVSIPWWVACKLIFPDRFPYYAWAAQSAQSNFLGSRLLCVLRCTCHLHFWQNDWGLLCATVVTQGWNGYRNKSSDAHFLCSPVIHLTKTQNQLFQPKLGPLINIVLVVACPSVFSLQCNRQTCHCSPIKFKPQVSAKHWGVDKCVQTAWTPCFGWGKQPYHGFH